MSKTPTQTLAVAAEHYRKFCEAVGIDLTKEDTKDTPTRVAKMFLREFTAGASKRPPFNMTKFARNGDSNLVTVAGIRWVSLCRHHHLPVVGYAHVCYLPAEYIIGLSKIPRLVKWLAANPSVQEELTQNIKDILVQELQPMFAGVQLVAVHACMACRGVSEHESRTTTTSFHNPDSSYKATRDEFLEAISMWHGSHRGI